MRAIFFSCYTNSMAKIFYLDIPSGLETLYYKVVRIFGEPGQKVASTSPRLLSQYRRRFRKELSLFIKWSPTYDSFDSARKLRWTLYWDTLPFGDHRGLNGWPGSGFSAYIHINTPRYHLGLALLLDPPGTDLIFTAVTLAAFNAARLIYYNENLHFYFMVYGSAFGDVFYTSTDCVTWNAIYTPTHTNSASLAYSIIQGIYVLDGGLTGSGGNWYTSPNLTTWTVRSSAGLGRNSLVYCLFLDKFFGQNVYPLTRGIQSSIDGITWADVQSTPGIVPITGLSLLDQIFIVMVADDTSYSVCYISTDGSSFTSYPFPSGVHVKDICYSKELNLFLAVTEQTGTDNYLTSSDCINWTLRSTGHSFQTARCAYNKKLGMFLLTGSDGGSNLFLKSRDGLNFELLAGSDANSSFVIGSSEERAQFVVGTISNKIYYSTDIPVV